MKITTKTTKEQLKSFLGANVHLVQKEDKGLFDQLVYADNMLAKDSNKVTRKDLVDLAKSVMQVLGDKCVDPTLEPVAENSVKKLTKKANDKKVETKSEETVQTEEISSEGTKEEGKQNKKSTKKSLGKKEDKPNKGVSVPKQTEKEGDRLFPKTLTQDGDTFELADDIRDMEDLYKALENEETIVFAFHWTAKDIKQFGYYNNQLPCPKSFPHDLDLCTALHISEELKVAYALSMYTEANYAIFPRDLEWDDDTNMRYCAGIEHQIYRLVDSEDSEE